MSKQITTTTTTVIEEAAWRDFQLLCTKLHTNRSRAIRNLVVGLLREEFEIPELVLNDDGEYDYESQYEIKRV